MSRNKIIILFIVALVPIFYFSFFNGENTEDVQMEITQGNKKSVTLPAVATASVAAKMPSFTTNTNTLAISQIDEPNHEMSPIERIRAIKEKTELYQSVLKDHDTFSRYPGNNVTITSAEQDPLIQQFSVDERTTLSDDKTAALTVWSDQVTYQRGEVVTIFAKLTDENGAPIPSKFSAQLIYSGNENIQALDLIDKNLDGVNKVSFTANELGGKLLQAGMYKAIIVNDVNKLIDSVTFMLSDPGARFTGEYRDSLNAQGNLVIEAEVEVSIKDRFYLQASLYTELSDPIGITQMTAALDKGKHWLALEFYGLMIRDSKTAGPYLLKNISLARVTMPMQRAPLIHPQYLTQPYELSQFSAQKYSDLTQLK